MDIIARRTGRIRADCGNSASRAGGCGGAGASDEYNRNPAITQGTNTAASQLVTLLPDPSANASQAVRNMVQFTPQVEHPIRPTLSRWVKAL